MYWHEGVQSNSCTGMRVFNPIAGMRVLNKIAVLAWGVDYSCTGMGVLNPTAVLEGFLRCCLPSHNNWILTFHQPDRVTSGQSNSGISKCTFQNSSSQFTNPIPKQTYNTYTQTSNNLRVSLFNITPDKRVQKATRLKKHQISKIQSRP